MLVVLIRNLTRRLITALKGLTLLFDGLWQFTQHWQTTDAVT